MPSLLLMRNIIMNETILSKLLTTCPFPEVYEDTEQISDSAFPVPKQKIGHIRADHDGWRWHNTVWPCHKALATNACYQEIDRIYEELTSPQALKDLHALRAFCRAHMDACISKEYEDEIIAKHKINKEKLKKHLDAGDSLPVSRQKAVEELMKEIEKM